MRPENPSFHAHHSPMGALASFTCGAHGAKCGMGLELSGPYPGALSVGYHDASGTLHLLPLFEGSDSSEAERYVEAGEGAGGKQRILKDVSREYLWATDRISAPGVTFEIVTPFFAIPDPKYASPTELAFSSCPVVQVSVTFKNDGDAPIRGLFALGIDHRWSSLSEATNGALIGASSRDQIGFATQNEEASCWMDFDPISAMNRKHNTPEFLLGPTAGLEIFVPAGEERTLEITLGFFKAGVATYNRAMSYYYTQHFTSLSQVLEYGIAAREEYIELSKERDEELANSKLNDEQKFLIAHATRSYYGSSQWLWDGSQSVWVVNEGEYLMMNTFDLTVDMLFFEMRFNPWTVRNELEQFASRYSFYDEVFDPADPDTLYPGGISFTHDMGVMNHWSPAGRSSYEVGGLDRACFSHMTCEQLTNWVLCAGVYLSKTHDEDFLRRYRQTLVECFTSLQNRDHPDPAQRDGIMSFESSRTQGGGEITTYDSLDHSLGQSRRNIYLGGKMWASYIVLEKLFELSELDSLSQEASAAAALAAKTLTAGYDPKLGYIPAVLEPGNTSAIIPAIEALVYPYVMGLTEVTSEDGPYGDYIKVLKKHLRHVIDSGICLYEDGGWKLSSSADNSWMSKINLCQYVAREVLGFDFGAAQFKADQAHARWEREGSKLSACSDQFHSGVAQGSLYYPRIVTNILWLTES
ncbi:glycoside hydrolase family 52 protein [Pelagicoccus sp. SDUM812005]|uniref:glycoside hydrolase family 52 protein n=1 Tax=Pelagicoccus sp. SDUM812005 TaxID=3041257 RepID=UPI00280FD371|nr:glycoside hydrolase family 52 protein [Pelagicoccus sp. SDUM812005]MDQ8182170.1 glycoside hydrolase family 52 protein [Pelagicoccus sp. SDUM812005]